MYDTILLTLDNSPADRAIGNAILWIVVARQCGGIVSHSLADWRRAGSNQGRVRLSQV